MAAPEFDKALVCSTAHFTDGDNILLAQAGREHAEAPDTSDHFVADLGYGYLVWVNSDGDFTEYKDKLSDAFIGILMFAFNQGAQWVRFDRDAPELDDFPIFDW
jgi:hypothetical protein